MSQLFVVLVALTIAGAGAMQSRPALEPGAAPGSAGTRQPPSESRVAITGVTVVDVRTGQPVRNQTVQIEGKRITAIGSSTILRPAAGSRVIGGAGKYLIPGLIETHAHLFGPWINNPPDTLAQFGWILASGVTTVRDAGGNENNYVLLRNARDSGRIVAPRLVVSSFWKPSEARTDGATDAVRKFRARGYDQVKLRGLTQEQALDAINGARAAGLAVYGHTARPSGDSVESYAMAAVSAGISGLSHTPPAPDGIELLPPNRPRTSYKSTSAEMVESDLFDFGRILDRDYRWYRMLIDSMVALGTWFEPTLTEAVHDYDALYGHCASGYDHAAVRRYSPVFRAPTTRVVHASGRQDTVRRICERRFQFVRDFYRAGGMIVTGSDFPPFLPLGVPEEMRLLALAGLPPHAALRAATLNGAIALGRAEEIGTIEVGKYADLVLLDANPLVDVMNVRRISAVIADGRLLDRTALLKRTGTNPPMMAYDDLPEKYSPRLRALMGQRPDTLVDVVFTVAAGTPAADRRAFEKGFPPHLTITRVDADRVFAKATMAAVGIESRRRFVTRIDLAGSR